jgi:hypothetical protein
MGRRVWVTGGGGWEGVEGGAVTVPARVLEDEGDLPPRPLQDVGRMRGRASPNNGPQ